MLALQGHSGQVTAVAFSACGRWMVSAAWDGTLRLWERPAYEPRRLLRTPYDHAVTAAFSADSTFLAAGFRNRDVWPDPVNFGNLAWTPVLPRPGADPDVLPPQDTWFSLDGARRTAVRRIAPHPTKPAHVAVAGDDNVVRVWDASARVVARSVTQRSAWAITSVRYSTNGVLAWLSGADSRSGKVYLWEGSRKPAILVPIEQDHTGAMAFSPDGSRLYLGLGTGRLAEWTLQSAGRARIARVADCGLVDLAVSPDGRTLLLAGADGFVRLWDVAQRQVREVFDWRIGTITSVAFAPDGLTAAAAGDGVVLVWDVDP